MTFDFRAFLPLAARLAADSDEASARSAVSRAYYATFHHAKETLVPLGGQRILDMALKKAHHDFWAAIRNDPVLKSRFAPGDLGEVARIGDELRVSRVWADYRAGPPTPDEGDLYEFAAYAIATANELTSVVLAIEGQAQGS